LDNKVLSIIDARCNHVVYTISCLSITDVPASLHCNGTDHFASLSYVATDTHVDQPLVSPRITVMHLGKYEG